MLKALTIENFKGIKDPVRIDFKPINIFFGPNSSGKSTIIHALLYAREVLNNNLSPNEINISGETVDLGGFENFVYGQDLSNAIKIRLDFYTLEVWSQEEDVLDTYIYDPDNQLAWHYKFINPWIELTIEYNNELNKPFIRTYELGNDGSLVGIISNCVDVESKGYDSSIISLNPKNSILGESFSHYFSDDYKHVLDVKSSNNIIKSFIGKAKKAREQIGEKWEKEVDEHKFIERIAFIALHSSGIPINSQNFPFSHFSIYRSVVNDEGETIKNTYREDFAELSTEDQNYDSGQWSTIFRSPISCAKSDLDKILRYHGPLRKMPDRKTHWFSGDSSKIDKINDLLGGQDYFGTPYKIVEREYVESVDGAIFSELKKFMKSGEEKERQSILNLLEETVIKKRTILCNEKNNTELSFHDVGFGISQVCPVLTACFNTGKIVAIEQPELHLHPKHQAVLADVFIKYSYAQPRFGEGNYFILETHGETLILRILKRIRQTNQRVEENSVPISPDDVSLLYVSSQDNNTTVKPIRISKKGELIDPVPGGFFEEDFNELF